MNFAKVVIVGGVGKWGDRLFYQIPDNLVAERGTLVEVPFGRQKKYAVIAEITSKPNVDFELSKIKPISKVFSGMKLPSWQMDLFDFMVDYYRASSSKAIRLFLPRKLGKNQISEPTNTFYKIKDQDIKPRGSKQVLIIDFLKKHLTANLNDLKKGVNGVAKSHLNPMIKKGMIDEVIKGKFKPFSVESHHFPDFKFTLTEAQADIFRRASESKDPVLLHGITGSGKTEIYLRMIIECVKSGKSALLLLPEIALTPQAIRYFQYYFGDHMALFHSKLTDAERVDQWWKVKKGAAPLVIGSRSALFSPLENIGLVILDEEHEWTYKQESNPYYETHLLAEKLNQLSEVQVVLGSATPKAESYYKAKEGKYLYLHLPDRVHGRDRPPIEVVDLRDEFKKKNFSIFSLPLQTKMADRLEKGQQVILFVNQRGAANAVVCRDCGYKEECPRCSISLKFHQYYDGKKDQLICHYCDYRKNLSLSCPSCSSVYIKHIGLGTQRVETDIKKRFPSARVVRADQDSIKKESFESIYHRFLNHEYDILIGTQMVAKGLDFSRVGLIGIILADIGLHIPDFRSSERLFQILTQVAGRCGRGEIEGEVVLQTYQPSHPVIKQVANYNYLSFIEDELKIRGRFGYPPFHRMIKFVAVGDDPTQLKKQVEIEKQTLEDLFKIHQLDFKILVAPAMRFRLADRFYYQVLIRSENPQVIFNHWNPPVGWRIDIDPVHTA